MYLLAPHSIGEKHAGTGLSGACTVGSLFSGVGGLELSLERAGLGPVLWQVEIDPWCRRVLARHWPEARRYDDVRSIDTAALAPVDVICGGFPCQPVSVAGKRGAQSDPRWLWPAMRRIIEAVRPAVVVVENVLGLRTAGLRDVLADLAALGLDAEWTCASAADLGAPHLRRRIYLIATDPRRIIVRQQPGWLSRAFESARAPVGRDALAACPPPVADPLRRLESAIRVATLRGWAGYCGWQFGAVARVG